MVTKATGNPPGRPSKVRKALEAAARAEATGESVTDAAKGLGDVSPSTVYQHLASAEASSLVPYKRLPAVLAPAVPSPPAPVDLEAVRRLLAAGKAGPRLPAQLADELGLDASRVREVLLEIAALEAADALPPDVARAESIAFARILREVCKDNADAAGALRAQAHMDRLHGIDRSDAIPRPKVVAMLRRCVAALARWPEALAAFRVALED